MTLGNMRASRGVSPQSVAASGRENDLSTSRHETHDWRTLDAKAPVFNCARCWIDGGDPMASRPCPGVRMRPFDKSTLVQVETKNGRDDRLKPTKDR
jgi:hypothetical protein